MSLSLSLSFYPYVCACQCLSLSLFFPSLYFLLRCCLLSLAKDTWQQIVKVISIFFSIFKGFLETICILSLRIWSRVDFINIFSRLFSIPLDAFFSTQMGNGVWQKAHNFESLSKKCWWNWTAIFDERFTPENFCLASKYLLNRPQALISATFYKQLLRAKITKVQNNTDDLTVFCTFGIFAHKSCA